MTRPPGRARRVSLRLAPSRGAAGRGGPCEWTHKLLLLLR